MQMYPAFVFGLYAGFHEPKHHGSAQLLPA